MATFRKRGNWWSYRIDMGKDPLTNKRIQPTFSKSDEFPDGFKTKKEAQKAANDHQNELDRGTYVKIKDIMFVDFAKIWFEAYSRRKKPSTIRARRNQLIYFTRYFVHEKLKNIIGKKYQDFLYHMQDEEYADATINGVHSTGNMLFKYAQKEGYIKVNPTLDVEIPSTQLTVEEIENKVEIPKYLEKEELALFLKTAAEHGEDGDFLIFLTLSYSGMRDGELLALKKTDFLRDRNIISITKTYFSDSGRVAEFELLPPKTKSSIREIEVDPMVFDTLDSHIAKQKEFKMLHRKTYNDQGFIFVNTDEFPGYPLNHAALGKRMKRILKLANLDTKLTPHSLRHTHVSLCAEAKVSLEDIQNRLGHFNDKTTKLVYMHVTKTRKKDAAKMFSDLMKSL